MTDLGERSDHSNPQPTVVPDDALDPPAPAVVELDMPSRVDLVAVARMVIAAAAGCRQALAGDRLDDLRLLTSEATTNAIEANLASERPGRVCVGAELSESGLTLTVADQGGGLAEFPEALSTWTELPDLRDPDQRLREGGFGLPLMHLLSSRPVVFFSGEQGTTVRLHLTQDRPSAE